MVDVDIDTNRAGPDGIIGSLLSLVITVTVLIALQSLGVVFGYVFTEVLNQLLGWSLNPRYGALIGGLALWGVFISEDYE